MPQSPWHLWTSRGTNDQKNKTYGTCGLTFVSSILVHFSSFGTISAEISGVFDRRLECRVRLKHLVERKMR